MAEVSFFDQEDLTETIKAIDTAMEEGPMKKIVISLVNALEHCKAALEENSDDAVKQGTIGTADATLSFVRRTIGQVKIG